MKKFSPLNEKQEKFSSAFKKHHIVAIGSAGTGKTYQSISLALEKLSHGNIDKIVIVRSAVPVRDIGFLPGDVEDKMAFYESVYIGMVDEILNREDAYCTLKSKGMVEFHPTSFLRGTTFNDCIIIADEIENFSPEELNTLMTRVGRNCQIVLCGDII